MSLTGSELQITSLHKLYTQSKQQKKKTTSFFTRRSLAPIPFFFQDKNVKFACSCVCSLLYFWVLFCVAYSKTCILDLLKTFNLTAGVSVNVDLPVMLSIFGLMSAGIDLFAFSSPSHRPQI